MLNFDELRQAHQDAVTLVELRTKHLKQLEERGAAEAHIWQARQDLAEAKEIAKHATRLLNNNHKPTYVRESERSGNRWRRIHEVTYPLKTEEKGDK